jgi:hypothetical protein
VITLPQTTVRRGAGPVHRTLWLELRFRSCNDATATRKVRSLLKWLLRTWGIRCSSIDWSDEAPPPSAAAA